MTGLLNAIRAGVALCIRELNSGNYATYETLGKVNMLLLEAAQLVMDLQPQDTPKEGP